MFGRDDAGKLYYGGHTKGHTGSKRGFSVYKTAFSDFRARMPVLLAVNATHYSID